MAHDFLGTFNRSQWDRFLHFARSQLPVAQARIQHLEAEIQRIGIVVFKYDRGIPQGFAADPPTAYLGKLLAAYEVQGGNPFLDLRTRLKNDPVFVVRGSEANFATYMSNGEAIGARGLSDAPTAEYMRQARSWIDDTLQYRFGALERKIRRALDYSEQLQQEIEDLKVIVSAATLNGSLEAIANQIGQIFGDRNYRAIFDDSGSDPFGFNTYAPFSSYDAQGSNADSPQRQNTGFVGPGQKGAAK